MRPGIWDDTERSDDRLKYTEDRQATGSQMGHGENAHFALHTLSHILVMLDYFPIFPNLVGTFALAQVSLNLYTTTQMHALTCGDLKADPELTGTYCTQLLGMYEYCIE